MWGLRHIVMTPKRIGVVLAGSGLLRVFTDNYKKAMYGSIEHKIIKTFDWELDRKAIEDTFLPAFLRDRLCPEPARFDAVIQRAYELSGGHPYYLSMLGYSAAATSRGHSLSPALLNRVSEHMMRGKVSDDIGPAKFYGHTFDSLGRLEAPLPAVAQIILAHIAENTTVDFPWLQRSEAAGAPGLVGVPAPVRHEAVNALEQELVIESERNPARVRIRVPLTAAALRERGPSLRQEAAYQLEQST